MKKITRIVIVLSVVSLSAVTKSKAQVEFGVSVQLNRPAAYEVNERTHPHRPSARHIWVAEEWAPSGNTYVYRPGHWELPPAGRRDWVAGHWAKRQHAPGVRWVAGHWR
jgi:hypothetical protein